MSAIERSAPIARHLPGKADSSSGEDRLPLVIVRLCESSAPLPIQLGQGLVIGSQRPELLR